LADNALLAAFLLEQTTIEADIIHQIVRDRGLPDTQPEPEPQTINRRGYFYDAPNSITTIFTASNALFFHRHEIQQPPSPSIRMVSRRMNGLAGAETYTVGNISYC
jgi:hypothetical protein